jgi:hypothetical protein
MTETTVAVRRSVTVQAPPERAFEVFTAGFSTWWPLESHHIGAAVAVAGIIEPHAGDRWFERDADDHLHADRRRHPRRTRAPRVREAG